MAPSNLTFAPARKFLLVAALLFVFLDSALAVQLAVIVLLLEKKNDILFFFLVTLWMS